MGSTAIVTEGLGKRYWLGEDRHLSVGDLMGHSLVRTLLRRKEIDGPGPDRDWIWALRDASLSVEEGETVGIVGSNGAGKTTLFKILCRITKPSEGRGRVRGRVGSMLEVGTGFHPELTGRENVYLNGAILGMSKAYVGRRFEEIAAFAEVDRFLDTPVKRYSTGMQLRLAFAVAAHLEPEILLVDEVLAVGDAAFQKKCLGKIDEVAREGRTVLYVSHNLGSVIRLCDRVLWLENGRLALDGEPREVIRAYLERTGMKGVEDRSWAPEEAPGDATLRLLSVEVCQPRGVPTRTVQIDQPFEIQIDTYVEEEAAVEAYLGIQIVSGEGQVVLHSSEIINDKMRPRRAGRWRTICSMPPHTLNSGTYHLSVGADEPNRRTIFKEESVLAWSVETAMPQMGMYQLGTWRGAIGPGLPKWTLRRLPG